MLKTCTFISINRTRKFCKPARWYTSRKAHVTENYFENIFSDKEKQILDMLNTSSLDTLARYIQIPSAMKIIQDRIENGPFESINDLGRVKDIEFDVLNGMWILLINPKYAPKVSKLMISPKINIKVPDKLLAYHVGPNLISWAIVNPYFKVLTLDYIRWNCSNINFSSHDVVTLATFTAKILPPAPCYVFEDFPYKIKLSGRFSSQQKLTYSIASCVTMLNKSEMDPVLKNNLYVLQPLASAQFFNLAIDEEMLTSRYVIKRILYNSIVDIAPFKYIYINPDFKVKLIDIKSQEQEQIGWSLLKAITCMYLLKIFQVNET